VIVPDPVPMLLTERIGCGKKLAVTDLAASIVTLQLSARPLHAPDHPLKYAFTCAVAVSVTVLPAPNELLHVPEHVMPAGADVIVPSPLTFTESVTSPKCARAGV
jgi:hypothetical protein